MLRRTGTAGRIFERALTLSMLVGAMGCPVPGEWVTKHDGRQYYCDCWCSTQDKLPVHAASKDDRLIYCGRPNVGSPATGLACGVTCQNYVYDALNMVVSCNGPFYAELISPSLPCDYDVFQKAEKKLMSAIPRDTSIEGPVDFGRSHLTIRHQNGDYLRAPVTGKVAARRGNCPAGTTCPIEFWYVDLFAVDKDLVSEHGVAVRGLRAHNANIWRGTKLATDLIQINADGLLTVTATLDEAPTGSTTSVTPFAQSSHLMRDVGRAGPKRDNALIVDVDFMQEQARVELYLHVWLTDCEPKIDQATATCGGDPVEFGQGKPYLRLKGQYKKLDNLLSNDLCNAMRADDLTTACSTSGDVEFPSFACSEKPQPNPTDSSAVAKELQFSWRDALGNAVSTQPEDSLAFMPRFPLTITVSNEWNRSVSFAIAKPTGTPCPPLLAKFVADPWQARWRKWKAWPWNW